LPAMGTTSILDLYSAKLQAGLTAAGTLNQVRLNQEMQKIVPWEFFKGQKFDINRWLGDGVDNDADGFRDDMSDAFSVLNLAQSRTTELAFRSDDLNNDGISDDNDNDGRIDVPNFSVPAVFKNVTPS